MNKQRLLKIEQHLRNGVLGHKIFDFGQINTDNTGHAVPNKCGTLGCAMGEFPIIFSDDWKFSQLDVRLKENSSIFDMDSDVSSYLEISRDAVDHLFYPDMQDTEEFGGILLDEFATKEKVADNILAFIHVMDEKTIINH